MAKLYCITPSGIIYGMSMQAINTNSGYVNNNGWCYFPSGMILQWGIFTNVGIFTLNLEFPSGSFVALCSVRSNNEGPQYAEGNPRINIVSKSQLYIDGGSMYNWTGIYWMVIGY